MLRWKLKKSVPFEVDETLISYMRQTPREDGVDVVTALSRLRIIREYETLAENAGLYPGVVLSSSLAAVALLQWWAPTKLGLPQGGGGLTVVGGTSLLIVVSVTLEIMQNLDQQLKMRQYEGFAKQMQKGRI